MVARSIDELQEEYEAAQARVLLQQSVVRDTSRAAKNAADVCKELCRIRDGIGVELEAARRAAKGTR